MPKSQEQPKKPERLAKSTTASDHVLNARAKKRSEAEEIGVTDQYISDFVEQFYDVIREDDMLGPIFGAKIKDWPTHLGRMKTFWRSVLHNSGEYSGNPMQLHVAMPELGEEHFAHWLTLFYKTLDQLGDRQAAELVGARARMIASSLLTAIEIQGKGIGGLKAGENLPHV